MKGFLIFLLLPLPLPLPLFARYYWCCELIANAIWDQFDMYIIKESNFKSEYE